MRALKDVFGPKTISFSSLSDHLLNREGVICNTDTPLVCSVGNKTLSKLLADPFTDLVVTKSEAPLERAKNKSTTLGSNVEGEDKNMTS